MPRPSWGYAYQEASSLPLAFLWAPSISGSIVAVTREWHGDLFLDAIVEGPHDWAVRPVAEAFYEHEFGGSTTTSGLIGAIWQVRDDLAFDVGLRSGRIDGRTFDEVGPG